MRFGLKNNLLAATDILPALVIAALVVGIRAFRKGERSWAARVGLAPAILVDIFWVLMIVGEFIFPH